MKVRDKYKAVVAAVVSFAGTAVSVRYGIDVPVDQISSLVVPAIVSATSGLVTWAIPNME